eukprot:7378217-Heterocapsa_arctica.AAC.1
MVVTAIRILIFVFLGNGFQPNPSSGMELRPVDVGSLLLYRALLFVHSRCEIHVQEPIGKRATSRDPMCGTHSCSQSSGPSDSPGSK